MIWSAALLWRPWGRDRCSKGKDVQGDRLLLTGDDVRVRTWVRRQGGGGLWRVVGCCWLCERSKTVAQRRHPWELGRWIASVPR